MALNISAGAQSPNPQCPVCDEHFPSNEIQDHVESCLERDADDVNSPSQYRFRDDNRKRARVDAAAWGCLAKLGETSDPSASLPTTPRNSRDRNASSRQPGRNRDSTKKSLVASKDDNININTGLEVAETVNSFRSNAGVKVGSTTPKYIDNSSTSLKSSTSSTEKKSDIIKKSLSQKPLAEQMRPNDLINFCGQEKVVGYQKLLRSLIEAQKIPSMILWGPPGCGKTTLAKIIANSVKSTSRPARFVSLSATTVGVNNVKEVIQVAKTEKTMFKKITILFMDEIHRFNKLQQDTFLPHIEDGTIVLIGATTENPSFSLNSALLSRCRVFVLEKLSSEDVEKILLRALHELEIPCISNASELKDFKTQHLQATVPQVCVEKSAITFLADFSDGDARTALNSLQLAIQSEESGAESKLMIRVVNKDHIKDSLQRSHTLYDRKGDEHYNCISALIKSMRGSDDNASLYWLARMLAGGEDPLYIARRMIRFASEDVGLADPLALSQAISTYQGCQFIGLPECNVILAQCAVYLSRARKSVEVYGALSRAMKCVEEHQGPLPGVPLHLRNAPTKLMKELGYGKDYKYNPTSKGPVQQEYLPEELQGISFFK